MTVRSLAEIGMVIVIVLLVTVGANPQKQNPTRQGKSQLACEKDYYGRIYPLLKRAHWDLDTLIKSGRASAQSAKREKDLGVFQVRSVSPLDALALRSAIQFLPSP